MTLGSYDVVVIGAGVVGAAIAWRLSQDDVRVLWLEAAHDVAEGASKANSAITASGYDTTPGTLESELIRASCRRWEAICSDLDVPYRRIGSLALAFTDEEVMRLEHLRAQADANGVEAEVVSREEMRRLAPTASTEALAALHVPAEGIIDPMRLTVGYAELAVRNGIELRLSTPARGFRRSSDGLLTHVETAGEAFAARFVVNAAGLLADEVSAAAQAEQFRIWPRKGQFLLVDREIGRRVTKILTPIPSARTRGILAVPTTNGTLLLGPTADDQEDKADNTTDEETLEKVLARAKRLVPDIARRHVIKAFAGLRPASDPVYRVELSERVPNLIHAAAIRSTGVSSSPAVADRVRSLLVEAGVELRPRNTAHARLPRVPRLAELPPDEIIALAEREEQYRLVVCACEHVSAAEIRAALDGAVAATSLDGVRKRTRAAAGRCQGAYCMAGIGFMLSIARGLAPSAIPQGEPGTNWAIDEA